MLDFFFLTLLKKWEMFSTRDLLIILFFFKFSLFTFHCTLFRVHPGGNSWVSTYKLTLYVRIGIHNKGLCFQLVFWGMPKLTKKKKQKNKKNPLLTEILPAAPSCGLRRKLPTKLRKPYTEIVGSSLRPKTRGQFLFSCGETKPLCHNSCSGTPRTCAPQQEKPPQWGACAPTTKSSPYLLQPEKARGQHRRPSTAKKNTKSLKK